MELPFISRFKNAWNAFRNRDPTSEYSYLGPAYTYRPDRPRFSRGNERTIVNSVFNRIALDVALLDFRHVRLDEDGRYTEDISSELNNCLTLEANIDQTGRAFIQDVVMSMMDEGVVAIAPIETSDNPTKTSSYDVYSMRTGKILDWYPAHIKVRVYNERTGEKEDVIIPKSVCGIIENPLFSVVNEPNSTLKRLVRKLALLDVIDEQSGSGKMDLIIQLPYVIKGELKKQQAEERRKSIEDQLMGSKYGIAYIDGTEHITQLNRPVENNLMKQIEYLTSMLYSQLGITTGVLDGSADEKVMTNYYNRSIKPIVSAICDEIKRKFLSRTARSQHQSVMCFRNPFELIPVNDVAEAADKLTRNEIVTSNEMRQAIGMKPSKDPKADKLVNSNIRQPNDKPAQNPEEGGEIQNGNTQESIKGKL